MESEGFAASKRCQEFLECVVDLTLLGDQDSLTERFLGVKLFGRAVDYETATDSIVRVRANDVRRRLVQFYSTHRPESKVRIALSSGHYVPEFHWESHIEPKAQLTDGPLLDAELELPRTEDLVSFSTTTLTSLRGRWRRHKVIILTAAVLVVLIAGLLALKMRTGDLDAFWQPVLEAQGQPVLNLPITDTFQLTMDAKRSLAPLTDLRPGQTLNLTVGDFIPYHDWHISLPVVQATLAVALRLERKGKIPLIRVGTDLRRDELRGHPVIAIGSFSNPWTEANVNGLRFTFDRGTSDREQPRIRDSQNAQRSWSLAHTYPLPQGKDYAIVTRTFDPVTGEPFVSLAGLHSFGNQIAGEFVSQESSWKEIVRRAPSGWQKMNLQILLEADIVGTTPGTPKVLDVYFWK